VNVMTLPFDDKGHVHKHFNFGGAIPLWTNLPRPVHYSTDRKKKDA
jgi:hypothetical protein